MSDTKTASSSRIPTAQLVLCALFAALTAVCAQIIIPIGPVPVSLSLLPVLLCGALLETRYALLSMAVYMLLGLAGAPVFSNLTGGAAKLFGVTGGYIIGYLPCVALTAMLIRKWGRAYWKQCLAMAIGVIVCYAFGTAWFMVVYARKTGPIGLGTALGWCVFPYLLPDAVKIALASVLTTRLYPLLSREVKAA